MVRAITSFLVLIIPRAILLFYWLFYPALEEAATPDVFVPLIGVFFLPFTVLAYLLLAPGGMPLLDWLIVALGFAADIGCYAIVARLYRPGA